MNNVPPTLIMTTMNSMLENPSLLTDLTKGFGSLGGNNGSGSGVASLLSNLGGIDMNSITEIINGPIGQTMIMQVTGALSASSPGDGGAGSKLDLGGIMTMLPSLMGSLGPLLGDQSSPSTSSDDGIMITTNQNGPKLPDRPNNRVLAKMSKLERRTRYTSTPTMDIIIEQTNSDSIPLLLSHDAVDIAHHSMSIPIINDITCTSGTCTIKKCNQENNDNDRIMKSKQTRPKNRRPTDKKINTGYYLVRLGDVVNMAAHETQINDKMVKIEFIDPTRVNIVFIIENMLDSTQHAYLDGFSAGLGYEPNCFFLRHMKENDILAKKLCAAITFVALKYPNLKYIDLHTKLYYRVHDDTLSYKQDIDPLFLMAYGKSWFEMTIPGVFLYEMKGISHKRVRHLGSVSLHNTVSFHDIWDVLDPKTTHDIIPIIDNIENIFNGSRTMGGFLSAIIRFGQINAHYQTIVGKILIQVLPFMYSLACASMKLPNMSDQMTYGIDVQAFHKSYKRKIDSMYEVHEVPKEVAERVFQNATLNKEETAMEEKWIIKDIYVKQ